MSKKGSKKHVLDEYPEKHNTRYFDIKNEPITLTSPVEGYQHLPLQSLEIACQSIEHLIPDIQRRVWIAKENCCDRETSSDLSQDEQGAIRLYTMEWEPNDQCLYALLNNTLRIEDRQKLKPWFSYLKLILTALFKLPSVHATVWRGVKADLSNEYVKDHIYTWYGFSSTTESLSVLESEQFLGKSGIRTLFSIECKNGKIIKPYSHFKAEDEILLLPATQFQVISKTGLGNDLNIIHLKEVKPKYSLLESPFDKLRDSKAKGGKTEQKQKSLRTISDVINNESQSYQNNQLKEYLIENRTNTRINLSGKQLTDNDMKIVANELQQNEACIQLNLNKNNSKITIIGLQYLFDTLKSNTVLQELWLAHNNLSDQGAKSIAQLLSKPNCAITVLDFSGNLVTDEGVKSLSGMLRMNQTLISLHLDDNKITDRGMKLLTNALKTNSTSRLELLWLQRNEISDNSIDSIIEVMGKNGTNNSLWSLNLSGNPISSNAQRKIQQQTRTKGNITF
ncbi:unnamed protein product [Didymodactylos carnosus]|uniref:NAD(P)(+)--arginine ADP-ribosyltransferase n=1 Tax=Didymodactylos carnosus TaxID=1234261 RepID=A0A814N383_9BILA|nr:unnamed protein product [Didymodactylos carnosus]CAF3850451.1 unnamed protein product [Didymodactylos carnosus]